MKSLTIFILSGLFFIGCSRESDQQSSDFDGEGIQVEGAWARPASEGRMSAAYFLVTNFESTGDTLVSVESDVAQLVEVHESYESEGDMMGMREVPELELPPQSTIRFQQGGLHVMLIQVTRTLAKGDTFELTLHFKHSESQTIDVPVRL